MKRLLLAGLLIVAFVAGSSSKPIQYRPAKDEECWKLAERNCSAAVYFDCIGK